MRPLLTAPWALVLACTLPAVTLADGFSDFRIPDHRTSQLGLGLNGSFSRDSQRFADDSQRNTDWNGNAQGFAAWRGDSDPREWDFSVDGVTFVDAGRNASDRSFGGGFVSTDRYCSHFTSASEDWSLQGGARLYPGSRPVGFELRGTLRGNESQQWLTSTDITEFGVAPLSRGETDRREEGWSYQEDAQLDASIGMGRVRDATPVFEAILLEERFRRDHILVREVSPAARQRLSELFALRGSFSLVHDLPDKLFWGEVERLLREDGALLQGADAFAWVHANERLQVVRSFERACGFFLGPVLSARHSHRITRQESAIADRTFSDGVPISEGETQQSMREVFSFDQTSYGFQAEYHRPLGDRSQFDLAERALIDFKGQPDAFEVTGGLELGHLIGERWFLHAFFEHDRLIRNRAGSDDSWSFASGGSVEMFLEDFLRLQLNVTDLRQRRRKGPLFVPAPPIPSVVGDVDTRSLRTSLSLVFARGSLTAPGLGVRERPLQP